MTAAPKLLMTLWMMMLPTEMKLCCKMLGIAMTAKLDLFARRREGVNEGHWCILDYGDVMVHIFHEQDREYYQLERLWSNGTNEVEVALDGAGAAAEA